MGLLGSNKYKGDAARTPKPAQEPLFVPLLEMEPLGGQEGEGAKAPVERLKEIQRTRLLEGYFQQAAAAEEAGDHETERDLYEKAAGLGSAAAMYNLGLLYSSGQGFEADLTQALSWYQKAAELGDRDAQFSCGLLYANGEGTAQDSVQALHWLQAAAEQGHPEAQYFCGLLYANGEGAEADLDQAKAWLQRAADQGHAQAGELLNALTAEQEEVPEPVWDGDCKAAYEAAVEAYEAKDYKKSLALMEQVARQGHAVAQYRCGCMYYQGRGVEADAAKALSWFEKAGEQGERNAQAYCGVMYYNGDGCAVDKAKALCWYEKLAEQGDALDQYMCGLMYLDGVGTERDLGKARSWLQKAADQGYEDAVKLLNERF